MTLATDLKLLLRLGSKPKSECLENTNGEADKWRAFLGDGDYDKEWYDVRLPDGQIVKHCWPNAGRMNATDGSGQEWGAGQCEVRLSPDHPAF